MPAGYAPDSLRVAFGNPVSLTVKLLKVSPGKAPATSRKIRNDRLESGGSYSHVISRAWPRIQSAPSAIEAVCHSRRRTVSFSR